MLNIYEIKYPNGEKEWCTGSTTLHALFNFTNKSNCDLHDLQEAEIKKINMRDWHRYHIDEEDGPGISFDEWMKENGEEPGIICGTFYL